MRIEPSNQASNEDHLFAVTIMTVAIGCEHELQPHHLSDTRKITDEANHAGKWRLIWGVNYKTADRETARLRWPL